MINPLVECLLAINSRHENGRERGQKQSKPIKMMGLNYIAGFEGMLEEMQQQPNVCVTGFDVGFMRPCQKNYVEWWITQTHDDIEFHRMERKCRDDEKAGLQPLYKCVMFHCDYPQYPRVEWSVVGNPEQMVRHIAMFRDLKERSAPILKYVGKKGECTARIGCFQCSFLYRYKKPWSILDENDDLLDEPRMLAHKFFEFWETFIDVWNLHFPEFPLCNRFLHENRALVQKEPNKSLFCNPSNRSLTCTQCEGSDPGEQGSDIDEEEESDENEATRESEAEYQYLYHWFMSDLFLTEKEIENALERMRDSEFDPCNRYRRSWDYPRLVDFRKPTRIVKS